MQYELRILKLCQSRGSVQTKPCLCKSPLEPMQTISQMNPNDVYPWIVSDVHRVPGNSRQSTPREKNLKGYGILYGILYDTNTI